MADIVEGVHPTRMELLEINKRIQLAEKGHKLLKERRDSLITKFFEIVDKSEGSRQELVNTMERAYNNLIKTEMMTSSSEVKAISRALPESKKIKTSMENILGVKTPKLEMVSDEKFTDSYSMISTSSTFDDSVHDFNDVLKKILDLIEMEESIRRLGNEIKKTKRRVNALEYLMIPRLRNTQTYIEMRLEEMERENFFRLKIVKRKKERELG
ncbi:MAG TPA: V-type ATP synthase subunit D [Candidatus Altiarchaeales archaeon]|nr:V-type ATP synthase subunit D [Candidatus Altiarchaeales archaeon]